MAALVMFSSCQKEIDGTLPGGPGVIAPTNKKPKLGTTWTYRFDTFYSNGFLDKTTTVVHQAVSEEAHGTETWLNVIDTATHNTVYLLKEKTGGLFQYANNNEYQFCKDSATLNESYTGYEGTFTVRGVRDSLAGYLGTYVVNYYEVGPPGGDISNKIWYSPYYWIVQRFVYTRNLSNIYYRRSAMYLTQISY